MSAEYTPARLAELERCPLGVWIDPDYRDEDHPRALARPFRSKLELFDHLRRGLEAQEALAGGAPQETPGGAPGGHGSGPEPREISPQGAAEVVRGLFRG